MRLSEVFKMEQFSRIRPLLEQVVPASSAPVERVFLQSGLVMKPNRARTSDTTGESVDTQTMTTTTECISVD